MKKPKTCIGFRTWYKRPVAIKAKQMSKPFSIKTLEGTMSGKAGDYHIIGIRGEHYPCQKDIFEGSYDKFPAIPASEVERDYIKRESNNAFVQLEGTYLDLRKSLRKDYVHKDAIKKIVEDSSENISEIVSRVIQKAVEEMPKKEAMKLIGIILKEFKKEKQGLEK